MSLLGRLLGTEPPKVPAGAKLIVCDQNGGGVTRWVAWVLPGPDEDDVANQHRCSPTFQLLADAQAWRDWMLGPKASHPGDPVVFRSRQPEPE